jgi:hypothetical protein
LKEALALLAQTPVGERAKVEVLRDGRPTEIVIVAE